jgi:hypothetical protein
VIALTGGAYQITIIIISSSSSSSSSSVIIIIIIIIIIIGSRIAQCSNGLDDLGLIPGRSKIFFSTKFRPALGYTQPPIQWVLEFSARG